MTDNDIHIPGVLKRFEPKGDALPLMFDSPHSGRIYPDDFGHDCPREAIEWGEDTYVDELYLTAPDNGAWMLAAAFPRTYIDPNRAVEDMDPNLVDGEWPHRVSDNPKIAEGIGLIWNNAGRGIQFYDRKLSVAEVENRIKTYWQPYQDNMHAIDNAIQERWGKRWHINCHSMPSVAFGESIGKDDMPVEDIVLGDRDGTTCSSDFTNLIAEAFRAEGLSVAVNSKFKGVELVRRHGNPANGLHSLQIEIDRKLYMDEATLSKTDGFAPLQQSVANVTAKIADYVRGQIA